MKLLKAPWIEWVILFFFVNLVCHLSGGINPVSRLLPLFSLKEQGNFQIDAYRDHTSDWSRTPDGHYYSNKAPGPTLLAIPVFFLMDGILVGGLIDRGARDEIRIRERVTYLKVFSYLLQIFPFLILTVGWMRKFKVSLVSVLALLFGNTAALMMSTYYGHGMTALWMIGGALAFLKRSWFGVGLCFGFSVLCDYGTVLAGVPIFWALILSKKRVRNVGTWVFGGILPGMLWVIYHTLCFGGPFNIANQFQNPAYIDVGDKPGNVWGVLTLFPDLKVVGHLLFGVERGILFTQPWVILFLGIGLMHRPIRRNPIFLFCLTTFVLLLWMNASFGGWHGGLTPGPRYLSAIFPLLAMVMGLVWEGFQKWERWVLSLCVAFSVFFSLLVYCTHLSAPLEPLWPYYFRSLAQWTPTILSRFVFVICATALTLGVSKSTILSLKRRR